MVNDICAVRPREDSSIIDWPHRLRPTAATPRSYRKGPPVEDLPDLFADRVRDYRATVVRCRPADVEFAIANAVVGRSTVVPPDLPWQVPGAVADNGQAAAQLDGIDAVVTAPALGIADTGTIVLDHGPGQGRRALTLLPDLHICVINADQIVAGVPAAVARLAPERPQTWISGPSATSDIELNRVEGVHGPRTLHILLVHPDGQ